MVDIKALIAKQREELEVVKQGTAEVSLGGALVKLTFERVSADEWDALVGMNPPRPGLEGDATLGYNAKGVSALYPRVQIDGELQDAETWAEVYKVLDVVNRNSVDLVIWGININETMRELRALGKARADEKSSSPAN